MITITETHEATNQRQGGTMCQSRLIQYTSFEEYKQDLEAGTSTYDDSPSVPSGSTVRIMEDDHNYVFALFEHPDFGLVTHRAWRIDETYDLIVSKEGAGTNA